MTQETIFVGGRDAVPVLFIPRQCTKLETNYDMSADVYIELTITSADTDGNESCIYSGFCNVKICDACHINIYPTETVDVEQDKSSNSSIDCEDINHMPVILSDASTFPTQAYNQSQVWIDPSRSPYVYNHYDTAQQAYSIFENTGCITVQQHNTYLTQNVYNYDRQSQKNDFEQHKFKKAPRQAQQLFQEICEDEESESEVFYNYDRQSQTNNNEQNKFKKAPTARQVYPETCEDEESESEVFYNYDRQSQTNDNEQNKFKKAPTARQVYPETCEDEESESEVFYNYDRQSQTNDNEQNKFKKAPTARQVSPETCEDEESESEVTYNYDRQSQTNDNEQNKFKKAPIARQVSPETCEDEESESEVFYNYDRQSQTNDNEQNKLKKAPTARQVYPEICEDEESESEVFLSQLSLRNKKTNKGDIEGKNNALKQLMSTDIQSTSKQRKTILFLGEDSTSGQTIQNIQFTDPMVTCSAIEVDHEVVIEDTAPPSPNRKKYQCDKCKQIFEQISDFRHHMKGNHTNHKVIKNRDLACSECGKKFSNYDKYEVHCLGHGNPDLECSKCHKVYASKSSLKTHMKIHDRKFPCQYCSKTYATSEPYKKHLKVHSKFVCQYDGCLFLTNTASKRDDHYDDHIENLYSIDPDHNNNDYLDIEEHFDYFDLSHKDQCNKGHHDQDNDGHNDQGHDGRDDQGNDDHTDEIDGNLYVSPIQSTYTEIPDSFMDNLDEGFQLITKECELKTAMSGEPEKSKNELKKNDNGGVGRNKKGELERNKNAEVDKNAMSEVVGNDDKNERAKADSVIAKVMSSKIFLANTKAAKKHARNNKTCQVCSKSFDRVGDLKRHLIEHIVKCTLAKAVSSKQGTLKINCEICQKETFNTIDKYKAHLREHAKVTLYKCIFCDKSFSDSSNFSKHKKIHGASYLQCDLCHRRFKSKIMIAKHIELHTKNKPLKCNLCHRVFHFQSMLNKHLKSMHKKPTASKFHCRFCCDGFTSLKDKWDHEWFVHNIRKTIVDCLVCNAKFRKYTELKRHFQDIHKMIIPTQKKILEKMSTSTDFCIKKASY